MLNFDEIELQHWAMGQAEFEGWGRDVVCYCTQCGEPIYDEEDFYDFEDGEAVHFDCLSGWAYRYKFTARMEDLSGL